MAKAARDFASIVMLIGATAAFFAIHTYFMIL